MCSTKALILLSLAAVAIAAPGGIGPGIGYVHYPKYAYSYGVADKLTGDHKHAHEMRDGGVVKGSYGLLQPDGIYRTVEYIADPIHGFMAKVINSPGPAIHAVAKKVVAPIVPPIHGHYGHPPIAPIAAVAKPVGIAYHHGYGPGIGGGYGGFGGIGGGGFGFGK